MAYGINVFRANGTLLLGMSTKLTRFLYHTVATAGNSGSQSISALVASRCVGFAVGRNNGIGTVGHVVTLSDGSVSWAPGSGGTSVDSDVYVIQYK